MMTVQEAEQHPLPWFGAIQGLVLVPPQHSLDVRSAPAALMTLNEGGQLIVYDMKTLQPLPLSLPLQELPPITASAFLQDAPPPEVRLRLALQMRRCQELCCLLVPPLS